VSQQVVGVVPAAGRARRLGSPAASKALEPVYIDPEDPKGPRLPVCYRLLHGLAEARVPEAFVVTLAEKRDLRDHLGDGGPRTPRIRHVQLDVSPSPVVSIAAATRLAPKAIIALGFPDVLWEAERAFGRLLARLDQGADVALGLFPPSAAYATAGVLLGAGDRVRGFLAPTLAESNPSWTLAAWRPVFSRILERLADEVVDAPRGTEFGMTAALQHAMEDGRHVVGVVLSNQPFFDIGAPARLAAARRRAGIDRSSTRRR